MSLSLESLKKDFPLSPAWSPIEVLEDVLSLPGLDIYLCGLSARHDSGQMIYAAAAQEESSPWSRSYFELLERAAVCEAELSGAEDFLCFTDTENVRISRQEVFPSSPQPDLWVYSKSNGVAAGRDREQAQRAAFCEIVERDRILRSWRGEIPPVLEKGVEDIFPSALRDLFELRVYFFPPSGLHTAAPLVCGVFGFPKKQELPLIFGFGCRLSRDAAIKAAQQECLQRLGFLWGAEKSPLTFSPTPDYHLEYYLRADGIRILGNWLSGAHERYCRAKAGISVEVRTTRFVDLTPEHLKGQAAVSKALCPAALPLIFGDCPNFLSFEYPSDLRIHPVA